MKLAELAVGIVQVELDVAGGFAIAPGDFGKAVFKAIGQINPHPVFTAPDIIKDWGALQRPDTFY